MPTFSTESKKVLSSCHILIQQVLHEAIKYYDFKVEEGHRSVERQQALYAQGRTAPGQKVTNIDGVRRKGMHNHFPSRAVDVTPWPKRWKDKECDFHRMAGVVLSTAARLGVDLRWGGDWLRFKDLPHFELGPRDS